MRDNQDKKLEAMLESRRVEPASGDLAERIILKAQEIPQNQTITVAQWIGRLFGEFHLPQPVYVLVGALILGFVIGFSATIETPTADDANAGYVQSFLSADEGLL